MEPIVEEHAYKHGLTEEQILYAWDHFVARQHRGAPNDGQIVVVGHDKTGQFIQIVAIEKPFGILIYHAMTPPTQRVLNELGIPKR